MPLLLALCSERRDIQIREIPLTAKTQKAVAAEFLRQEHSFRSGVESPYDSNWIIEPGEIAVTPIPPTATVFTTILGLSDTAVQPLNEELTSKVRGLAMKDANGEIIRVQAFSRAQVLRKTGVLSLLLAGGTYRQLDNSGFSLADKLACIVENGHVKFNSLHTLSRIINTSTIFSEATDPEVETFVQQHSSLFSLDLGDFLANTSRNARKYITSLSASSSLQGHTAETLRDAARPTRLSITVKNRKILMPEDSGGITELLRFLNDGRYVGPVSGKAFVTNSRRTVN